MLGFGIDEVKGLGDRDILETVKVLGFGIDEVKGLGDKDILETVKVLGFGIDEVKGLGDKDILETVDVFRLWAPEKLKHNWLAKRMGSDSFTIRDKRIQQTHE